MGTTNLKAALENSYAGWLGQLDQDERRAVEIVTMYQEELPVLTRRAAEMKRLLESAEVILTHIAPGWKRETVKPRRRNANQGLVEVGQVAKLTLDVLRETPAPLTAREIASRVVDLDRGQRRIKLEQRIKFAGDNGATSGEIERFKRLLAELDVDASPEERRAVMQRVGNAVDSTLRQKKGRYVDADDGNPKKWFVIRPPRLAA